MHNFALYLFFISQSFIAHSRTADLGACYNDYTGNSQAPLSYTRPSDCIRSMQAVVTQPSCSNFAPISEGNGVGFHAYMKTNSEISSPPLQITPLIESGPSHNRVDLVFFSDGYLNNEYEKFIQDASRLAQDISGNQTFNTVKPLLNFWAAFSPSKESGVGVDGVPRDTPFGLYRDGTELRAVYYSKPDAARAACQSMGVQCDYPILLGNDPLYGGLGGEFTVITSSFLNGPLVLRHELGHSIINVGEEYDGGFAYFGPNAAHDTFNPIPWANWLTNFSEDETKKPRIERSVMPMQAYPWTILNTTTPWSMKFNSSGTYPRHLVRFSLSGLPERTDLRVELDGQDLKWVPHEAIGIDRWHYDVHRNGALTTGEHEVKFTLLNGDREDLAQLCSTEILEFGSEDEFIATPGHYSLFPTFSDKNETSYRPTNEDCLMRIVTTPNFCKVCLEGLWLSLLSRVELIDDVVEGCEKRSTGSQAKILDLHLLPLAQFRLAKEEEVSESYIITWRKAGKVLEKFTNKTRLEIDNEHAVGTFTIQVQFATDQVRAKSELLTTSWQYNISQKCASEV